MRTTAISAPILMPYALTALLAAGLAGCAPTPPAMETAPLQSVPVRPQSQSSPEPPDIVRPVAIEQAPPVVISANNYNDYYADIPKVSPAYTAPKTTPLDDMQQVRAETLPEETPKPAKVVQPAVVYVPDKPKTAPQTGNKPIRPTSSVQLARPQQQAAPVQNKPAPSGSGAIVTAQAATAKPTGVPFWDQGRVQVEVLEMKKNQPAVPSGSPAKVVVTTQPMPVQATGQAAVQTVTASTPSLSPAAAVLLKQANNELGVGKPDRAAATLERALRIAPNDATLWLRLAEVNEQLGDKKQAAAMAKKALDLAPNDANIRLRSQRLL